jgi:hypothetical protein
MAHGIYSNCHGTALFLVRLLSCQDCHGMVLLPCLNVVARQVSDTNACNFVHPMDMDEGLRIVWDG